MRWLRIAIGITVSLLTALLYLTPVQAAQGNLWSVLLDHSGDLQLSDVSSPRLSNQFSPIELEELTAANPDEALWLRFRLQPNKHEQILRVFAPDLARLDLYVLDGKKLISETSAGSTLPTSDKPLSSSDYLLPLPQSSQELDVYLRLVSEHQLRPHITLDSAVILAANQGMTLLYGLLLGCLAMLVLHNLIRFAFTRSVSSLWLAACEALLLISSALFLNLLGPWFPEWHSAHPPGAYLALILTAPCGLMFTYSFFGARSAHRLQKLLLLNTLIICIGGLLVLFFDTLPLNVMTYGLVGLASLSILLVSVHHLQQGYRPARLFVVAMIVFNIGTLVILPTLLGLTLIAPQELILALMAVVPAEVGKVPMDIAEAKTEILEGLISEYSGRNLAMFKLTFALRNSAMCAVVVSLFFPWNIGAVLGLTGAGLLLADFVFFWLKVLLLQVFGVTVIRTAFGRLKIWQASQFYWVQVGGLALAGMILLSLDSLV